MCENDVYIGDRCQIAIYHQLDGDKLRMHMAINSANAMHYSVSMEGVELDDVLFKMCDVAPCIARLDAVYSEIGDGNLLKPDPVDVAKVTLFRSWGKRHDLQSHGDMFELLDE